ncbi:hypothetical protein MMC26_007625 [Xylographa opegraphella]|nr:hypothetical protein [Xylographa opegraphella]
MNLVQLGPRRGVFYAFVNVADGVVRIWREWLAQGAEMNREKIAEAPRRLSGGVDYSKEETRISTVVEDVDEEARTLWVDSHENVGIRVKVKQRSWKEDVPVILHSDEDPGVSYVMEYEELLVRTNHLLLAMERMLSEQNNASSKALVFCSFASQSET